MASHIKLTWERIRMLRSEADQLQEELNEEVQVLIEMGLVASRSDEDPIKAVGKYVQHLPPNSVISAAKVKAEVPCTRDLTHRGITAYLSHLPLLSTAHDGEDQKDLEKDQFGLKQFRRIDPNAAITAAAGDC